MNSIKSTSLCFLFLRRLVQISLLVIAPSVWAQVTSIIGPEPTARSIFTNAAPDATLAIDFEHFHQTVTNQTSGYLPDFTELGFVTFHTNVNYGQEIIYAGNVGQGSNNVYYSVAANHMLPLADVTFANGVMAVGFDLKAGGVNLVPQTFFAQLYSGDAPLGAPYPITTAPDGTSFEFAGFVVTSGGPITRIVYTSTGASPNLDLVLDNFVLSAELEVRITAIETSGNDVRLTWNTIAGKTNIVQATNGTQSGSYSNNYSDLSGVIIVPGSGQVSTNYLDSGGATNVPSRYYRVRLVP